jgi:hypothetical protein
VLDTVVCPLFQTQSSNQFMYVYVYVDFYFILFLHANMIQDSAKAVLHIYQRRQPVTCRNKATFCDVVVTPQQQRRRHHGPRLTLSLSVTILLNIVTIVILVHRGDNDKNTGAYENTDPHTLLQRMLTPTLGPVPYVFVSATRITAAPAAPPSNSKHLKRKHRNPTLASLMTQQHDGDLKHTELTMLSIQSSAIASQDKSASSTSVNVLPPPGGASLDWKTLSHQKKQPPPNPTVEDFKNCYNFNKPLLSGKRDSICESVTRDCPEAYENHAKFTECCLPLLGPYCSLECYSLGTFFESPDYNPSEKGQQSMYPMEFGNKALKYKLQLEDCGRCLQTHACYQQPSFTG